MASCWKRCQRRLVGAVRSCALTLRPQMHSCWQSFRDIPVGMHDCMLRSVAGLISTEGALGRGSLWGRPRVILNSLRCQPAHAAPLTAAASAIFKKHGRL